MEITELDSAQGKYSFGVRGMKDVANFEYDRKTWALACTWYALCMHLPHESKIYMRTRAHDLGAYHTSCTPETIRGARETRSATN